LPRPGLSKASRFREPPKGGNTEGKRAKVRRTLCRPISKGNLTLI